MANLSFTLINSTTFSTPSGNYDGSNPDFFSPKFRAAGYYGFTSALHTVAYFVTNFVGEMVVQVTLATDPVESDWTDLTATTFSNTTLISPITTSVSYNFTGNYVWVRMKVTDFQAGLIDKVQFNI